jgi:hypothetical protein
MEVAQARSAYFIAQAIGFHVGWHRIETQNSIGKPVQRVLKTLPACAKTGRNFLETPNFALVF